MPNKRWWDFEDGDVNFGSLDPKKNNLTSILLMEYVLVHSSDWYVIPQQMKVGAINKIEKFVVIDCFGEEAIIEPAGRTTSELALAESDRTWDPWAMFTISEKYKERDQQHYTPYFLLPPTIDYTLIGDSLEEIKILRDETTNLVWAVEKAYRTIHGEPISGYEHYLYLYGKITAPNTDNDANEDSEKPLEYRLMTSVPWNWIPFVPVHTAVMSSPAPDPSHKHIELQRGSMINPIDQLQILPNSRMLNAIHPYYIEESEIPRSGIILSEKYHRATWHKGHIFLWIGRKKSIGTGERSSGLQFDSVSLGKKL